MTGPTKLDAFWAEVQVELTALPRPWETLERLEQIDSRLQGQLIAGERWLVRQSDILRLQTGWAQWRGLYRRALALLDERARAAP